MSKHLAGLAVLAICFACQGDAVSNANTNTEKCWPSPDKPGVRAICITAENPAAVSIMANLPNTLSTEERYSSPQTKRARMGPKLRVPFGG